MISYLTLFTSSRDLSGAHCRAFAVFETEFLTVFLLVVSLNTVIAYVHALLASGRVSGRAAHIVLEAQIQASELKVTGLNQALKHLMESLKKP